MLAVAVGSVGWMLTACDRSNAEDERRLEIVVADPLLSVRPDGAVVDDEIDGSGGVAQGENPNLSPSVVTGAALLLETPVPMRSVIGLYLDELEAGGWQDMRASCSTADSGLVVLRAKRAADGFTLTSAIDVSMAEAATRVVVVVQAPFHTSDGPEIEGAPPDLDCLDAR